MTNRMNNSGFTILELLVSIFVSSIVIAMLVQMLTMSLQARQNVAIENRLKDESYLVVEQIKWRAFEMQTQSVSVNETADSITITFNHEYDIVVDPINFNLERDYTAGFTETLVYNKNTEELSYNSTRIHSSNVYFVTGTDIQVDAVDSTCDPTIEYCEDVVITLTLNITVQLDDGSTLVPKSFETTIII